MSQNDIIPVAPVNIKEKHVQTNFGQFYKVKQYGINHVSCLKMKILVLCFFPNGVNLTCKRHFQKNNHITVRRCFLVLVQVCYIELG